MVLQEVFESKQRLKRMPAAETQRLASRRGASSKRDLVIVVRTIGSERADLPRRRGRTPTTVRFRPSGPLTSSRGPETSRRAKRVSSRTRLLGARSSRNTEGRQDRDRFLIAREGQTGTTRESRRSGFRIRLGEALTGEGRYAEAEQTLLEANRIQVSKGVPRGTEGLFPCLAALYWSWNEASPGHGYDAKAAEWQRKLDSMITPQTAPSAALSATKR